MLSQKQTVGSLGSYASAVPLCPSICLAGAPKSVLELEAILNPQGSESSNSRKGDLQINMYT